MATPLPACVITVLLLAAVPPQQARQGRQDPQDQGSTLLDFANKTIPADWRLAAKTHRFENGELVVDGGGSLDWSHALQDRASVTLSVLLEEKANVEMHLVDERGEVRYAFAFLGQYHRVLDRVALGILRDNRFVHVNPRLWLYPGRKLELEVRRAKNQFQMFVNGELGGAFVDEQAVAGKDLKLRITWATEGEGDKVHLDDVRVALPR